MFCCCNLLKACLDFSLGFSFQLLKFLPREKASTAFYGFIPSSTLPCFKLKYKSTQRTTASPVNLDRDEGNFLHVK